MHTPRLLLVAALALLAASGAHGAQPLSRVTCIGSTLNGGTLTGAGYVFGSVDSPAILEMKGCQITGAPVTVVAASVEIIEHINAGPSRFTNAPLSITYATQTQFEESLAATTVPANQITNEARKLIITDVVFEGDVNNAAATVVADAMFKLDARNYAEGYRGSTLGAVLAAARLANFDVRDNMGIVGCIPQAFSELTNRAGITNANRCFRIGGWIVAHNDETTANTDATGTGTLGQWPAAPNGGVLADRTGLLFIDKYNVQHSGHHACTRSIASAQFVITKTNTLFGDVDPALTTADVAYGLTLTPANTRDLLLGKPADDCNGVVTAPSTVHLGRYVSAEPVFNQGTGEMILRLLVEDYQAEAVTVSTTTDAAGATTNTGCYNREDGELTLAQDDAKYSTNRFAQGATNTAPFAVYTGTNPPPVTSVTAGGRTIAVKELRGSFSPDNICGTTAGGTKTLYVVVKHEEMKGSGATAVEATTAVTRLTANLFFSADSIGAFSVTSSVANDLFFHSEPAVAVAGAQPHLKFPMQVCALAPGSPPIYPAFNSGDAGDTATNVKTVTVGTGTACTGTSPLDQPGINCFETFTLTISPPAAGTTCLATTGAVGTDPVAARDASYCCRVLTITTAVPYGKLIATLADVPFATYDATIPTTPVLHVDIPTLVFVDYWVQQAITNSPGLFVKVSAFEADFATALPGLALPAGPITGQLGDGASALTGTDVLFRFEIENQDFDDRRLDQFTLDLHRVVACATENTADFAPYTTSSSSGGGCASMPAFGNNPVIAVSATNPLNPNNPAALRRELYVDAGNANCRDHAGDNAALRSNRQCPRVSALPGIVYPTGGTGAIGHAKISTRGAAWGVCSGDVTKTCQVDGEAPDWTIPGAVDCSAGVGFGTCIPKVLPLGTFDGFDDAGVLAALSPDWDAQYCRKSNQATWGELTTANFATCSDTGGPDDLDTVCTGVDHAAKLAECSARTDIVYALVHVPTFEFDGIEVPVRFNFAFTIYETMAKPTPFVRRRNLLAVDANAADASGVRSVEMRHTVTIMPRSNSATGGRGGAGDFGIYGQAKGALAGTTADGRQIIVESPTGSVRTKEAVDAAAAKAAATKEATESDWDKANRTLREHPAAVAGLAVAMVALGVAIVATVVRARRVHRRNGASARLEEARNTQDRQLLETVAENEVSMEMALA